MLPENNQPQASPPLDPNLDLVGSDAPPKLELDREAKKEQKLFGEPKRREQFRQVIHLSRIIVLSVVVAAVLSVFVIRVLHFVLPENNAANAGSFIPHCWLTESQLGSMDKFIFGAIGAFVAEYLVKALVSENHRSREQ